MKNTLLVIALSVMIVACNNRAKQNQTANQSPARQLNDNTTADLFKHQWQLEELGSKAIVLDTVFKKVPYVVFNQADSSINGNFGCNGFGTKYEIKGDSIKLGLITATQMACPNLEIEHGFSQALMDAKTFLIENDKLLLRNDQQQIVALLSIKAKE